MLSGSDCLLGTDRLMTFPAPNHRSALILSGCVFAAYCWFVLGDYGQELYAWSKTFAPHSVRQYLGMSKRYLLQYGHMVFLFPLLVLSRYIFLSDRSALMVGPVKFLRTYSTAIFLFHFPILFFLVAVTDYDPESLLHQLALFFGTLSLSVIFGRLCFALKPSFDRMQKKLTAKLEKGFPRSSETSGAVTHVQLTRSHSEFLDLVKIVAMMCVFLGHFSFSTFSTVEVPGFNGAAPRFAVPTFFMISGYFLMLSIDRSKSGAISTIAKRGFGLYYIVLPMLAVTIALDTIGGNASPSTYHYSEYYSGVPLQDATLLNELSSWFREFFGIVSISDPAGVSATVSDHHPAAGFKRPYSLSEIVLVSISSLAYFNESWLFDLTGMHTLHGGMRAFSNDPFWFMCYLIPFSVILIIVRLIASPFRYVALGIWILLIGPPVLMLAPLFFLGSFAYLIHKHWVVKETVVMASDV